MTVTSTNLIQGPATLYAGLFGATEPASISVTPTTGWTDLGGTDGGVTLYDESEYSELLVDQVIERIESRRTSRAVSIGTNLAEVTLANLARAANNTAPVANVLEPDDGAASFKPAYQAIILDGVAPGGFRRRIILRKTLSTEAIETAYKKDEKGLIPVRFAAHWVSASIKSFRIEDATT